MTTNNHKSTRLTNPNTFFVSLVDKSASQFPFMKIKRDKAMTPVIITIKSKNKDKAKAIANKVGIDDFKISETVDDLITLTEKSFEGEESLIDDLILLEIKAPNNDIESEWIVVNKALINPSEDEVIEDDAGILLSTVKADASKKMDAWDAYYGVRWSEEIPNIFNAFREGVYAPYESIIPIDSFTQALIATINASMVKRVANEITKEEALAAMDKAVDDYANIVKQMIAVIEPIYTGEVEDDNQLSAKTPVIKDGDNNKSETNTFIINFGDVNDTAGENLNEKIAASVTKNLKENDFNTTIESINLKVKKLTLSLKENKAELNKNSEAVKEISNINKELTVLKKGLNESDILIKKMAIKPTTNTNQLSNHNHAEKSENEIKNDAFDEKMVNNTLGV